MFPIKGLAAAAVLIAALVLAPAAAAKRPTTPVTLEAQGSPLSAGATLEATSSTFELKNNAFQVHCTESSLTVTLKTNQGLKSVSATIESATLRGGATIDPEACESGPEWVLTWDPAVAARLELFRRGEGKISGAKLKMIPRENIGTRHEPGCHLKSNNLKFDFNIGETAQPLAIRFPGARFKIEPEQGPICEQGAQGHEPIVSGEFAFASEGHPVEVFD